MLPWATTASRRFGHDRLRRASLSLARGGALRAVRDGIATGLSRALVALEAYDYEPFERKGMEQAIHLVRSLLEATVD